jgi:hypothetical protein
MINGATLGVHPSLPAKLIEDSLGIGMCLLHSDGCGAQHVKIKGKSSSGWFYMIE